MILDDCIQTLATYSWVLTAISLIHNYPDYTWGRLSAVDQRLDTAKLATKPVRLASSSSSSQTEVHQTCRQYGSVRGFLIWTLRTAPTCPQLLHVVNGELRCARVLIVIFVIVARVSSALYRKLLNELKSFQPKASWSGLLVVVSKIQCWKHLASGLVTSLQFKVVVKTWSIERSWCLSTLSVSSRT